MNKYTIYATGLLAWLYFSSVAMASGSVDFVCEDRADEPREVSLESLKQNFGFFEGFELFEDTGEPLPWNFSCATLDVTINFLRSPPGEDGLKGMVLENLENVFEYIEVIAFYEAKDSFALPVFRKIEQSLFQFNEEDQKAIRDKIRSSPYLEKKWIAAFPLKFEVNGVTFTFVEIPGGAFMFGEGVNKREVDVAPFMMMTTEVTQKQWEAIMGNNPSHFKGEDLPVESVRYYDVQEFIARLNGHLQSQGLSIARLPTEEEWEYAARAGTSTRYFWGDNEDQAGDYAWHLGNSDLKTHPVAQKRPNPWGLYDTSGNVWEWTGSFWSENSQDRVFRGGGWLSRPRSLRSAVRVVGSPGIRCNLLGFRLLRTFTL